MRDISITRLASAAFALLVLGNLFGGCVATVKVPPGSVASDISCTNDLKCRYIHLPACMKNERQCYKGFCLMTPMSDCVPPPSSTATATTTVGPVPTVAPSVAPSPNPPSSNLDPTAPN
jgi:hypothetical protein